VALGFLSLSTVVYNYNIGNVVAHPRLAVVVPVSSFLSVHVIHLPQRVRLARDLQYRVALNSLSRSTAVYDYNTGNFVFHPLSAAAGPLSSSIPPPYRSSPRRLDFDHASLRRRVQPPSSRSSCFCGHRSCLVYTARIIMTKTKNQTTTSMQVNTQPRMRKPRLSRAVPTAKVAVCLPRLAGVYYVSSAWVGNTCRQAGLWKDKRVPRHGEA